MNALIISDIPRISAIFERLSSGDVRIKVVGEIHRGIEEMESTRPGLLVIQNHLSGLSADILYKHFRSSAGRRKVRFALITAREANDEKVGSLFDHIIDISMNDSQIEAAFLQMLDNRQAPLRKEPAAARSIFDITQNKEEEPFLSNFFDPPVDEHQEIVSITGPVFQVAEVSARPDESTLSSDLPEMNAYPVTSRSGLSIISDFSQQLDSTAEEFSDHDHLIRRREREFAIRDLYQKPHIIEESEVIIPLYRRTGFWIVFVTLAVVFAITLFQHSPRPAARVSDPPEKLTAIDKKPIKPDVQQPKILPQAGKLEEQLASGLVSHGLGRPKSLPSFVPVSGIDRNYSLEHPGWENYRSQTTEYRIFREKDSTIKALQIIDNSGGIQDSFYISVLKELAGLTSMRPTSSEIKEGYEIRRGEAAGLQIVQYRDAEGGRLRGLVVTWP